MNYVNLTDSATESTFFAYPVKGQAFITNDTLYIEKDTAAAILAKGNFQLVADLVEYHGEIYIVNGIECLSELFLFQMYRRRFTNVMAPIAERLFDQSFREALRACLLK